MVGLQLIAVRTPEAGMRDMPSPCVKHRIKMSRQPVMADLMANREILEAVAVHMGRVADAELTTDVKQHAGSTPGIRRQRAQLNVETAGDLERIDGKRIDVHLLKEPLSFPTYFNKRIGPPCHLVPFRLFVLCFACQHLNKVVGHLLIFGRQTGVVSVELIGADGRTFHILGAAEQIIRSHAQCVRKASSPWLSCLNSRAVRSRSLNISVGLVDFSITFPYI